MCLMNVYILETLQARLVLELDDTATYLINHIPTIIKYTSRADNARPETISKVKKDIPLIKACKKWKGSVEDGVVYLQSFKQIIYTLTRSVALVSYHLIITRQITTATRQQSYKTQAITMLMRYDMH